MLRPFLAGVFLEDQLTTSSRFFHLVWRCFAHAAPVLPARGMGALARQLAADLPDSAVRRRTSAAGITDLGMPHGAKAGVAQ